MSKYTVFVDDNFHFGDEEYRYKYGEYDTYEEAVETCIMLVDAFFRVLDEGKYTYKELWEGYTGYGEDPFITPEPEGRHFSAWEYAKEWCARLAAGGTD